MYHSCAAAISCQTGDVRLMQNLNTGLISNHAFDPNLMAYGADYQNEQAHSGAFLEHLDSILSLIAKHFANHSLIEVGCGKGLFLEKLQQLGYTITGVDPAYEGENPAILKQYFSPETGISAGGIVLRHVLEHIRDPFDFLCLLRDANGGRGKIYIEVPCFEWICSRCSWFDIFYEHVNYFRLSDFHRMFGRVHHAACSFNGQYLSIVAELGSLRTPVYQDAPLTFPATFTDTVTTHSRRLAAHQNKPAVVWGGASKGVIFAIFMARCGTPVHTIVDVNPAKQGKYLGVTGLRVSSPQELLSQLPDGSEIIVINSNYLDEIRRMTDHRFTYYPAD
ncbi:MAG: class I SAM-dependent methyltransferase [Blastochloris sp.]|nr:class I SAM-dependent methyltransferase [Blastochloris sp.]